MKVSTITTFAVAGMAQANVVPRDGSILAGLLWQISDSISNADDFLLNFESNPAALHKSGFDLLDKLDDCTEAAVAMPALSIEDVVSFADASYECSSIGTKFLNDLQAAAPLFAAHGFCGFAYQFSLNFAEASNKFFEANKAKFPAEALPMAGEEITAKNALFTQVQAALAPGVCVNQVELEPGNGPNHGSPSLPDTEPSVSTSIIYHTGTGLPPRPTPPPVDGGNRTGDDHRNGTRSGQPPKPVIGSARILGSSWSLAMLSVAAGVFML